MTGQHRTVRRTQAERRSATTTLLLDATIDALVDLGYARATTAEICERAGVSAGALFHYFPTRIDLVLAALDRAVDDRLARYRESVERVRAAGSGGHPARELLHVARTLARERTAMAWTEVAVAARTDPALAARLRPTMARRWRLIHAVVVTHPLLQAMMPESRELYFAILRCSLEVGAVVEGVTSRPGLDDERDHALLVLARHLGATALST